MYIMKCGVLALSIFKVKLN